MKNTVFMLFVIFFRINLYSQSVYYGYPVNDTLQKGDIAIVNLPPFNLNRGRIYEWEESDKMVDLIERHKGKTLRLEVNLPWGSAQLSKRLTENFCEDIQEILECKTALRNYRMVANGNENPIFLKRKKNWKKNNRYIIMNSRIDIFVE